MKKYAVFGLIFAIAAVWSMCSNQVEAGPEQISIAGDLPRTGHLSQEDLEKLGPVDIEFTLKEGTHTFRGVPVDKVLEHFGFDKGPETPETPPREKRTGWRKVLVASAPDGFQAVFSCAEVVQSMGATKAYLAWKMDGKDLPTDAGPFRLVVPSDQERARSIYRLNRIDVVDMQKLIPPATGENKNASH